MNTKLKYVALILVPILTIAVWVIWFLMLPSHRGQFLKAASSLVERNLTTKKRKSKGLRRFTVKKGKR
ncbi:hypothetical protein PBI_STAYER_46 [Arthrobacter phage Stayer]|nr:hypothetical protein PBI_STAYER_46 [Arthrobacter phage Stayer]